MARSAGPNETPCSCSSRLRSSRTVPRWSWPSHRRRPIEAACRSRRPSRRRSRSRPRPSAASKSSGGGGGTRHIGHGGSVGAGTWHAVETLLPGAHELHPDGWLGDLRRRLQQPGRQRASPRSSSARGSATEVSRPYAKIPGRNGDLQPLRPGRSGRPVAPGRLRRRLPGRTSGVAPAPNPYASVLGTHLYFQSEKPCGGYCHYANIMSSKMKYVGIGVWVGHGRVRLVIDFWEG